MWHVEPRSPIQTVSEQDTLVRHSAKAGIQLMVDVAGFPRSRE